MKNVNVLVNYIGDIAIKVNIPAPNNASDEDVLEDVFARFNHGSGLEDPIFLAQKVRSLSVHDLVRVDDKWYQCESVGWKLVTDEYVDSLERLVVNHPSFKEEGPWYALQQVMWNIKVTDRNKLNES